MSEQTPHLATDRHSPGPWRAARVPINPWWKVYIEGRDVAEVEGGEVAVWNDPNHPEAVEANARLIAAAPELLALARQYAGECAECGGTGMDSLGLLPCLDCEDIRAIIAKAEGRTNV